MSSAALKLTDFNSTEGASISAMTQSLAFTPVKAEDECGSCRGLETEIAALTARQADDFSSQLEQLKSRFQDEVEALHQALDVRLKDGLSQCLMALFPALADVSLRRGLEAEIRQSLKDSLPETLTVTISPELSDPVDVPPGVTVTQDPNLAGHTVDIKQGAARTRLDPDAILNSCLALLKTDTPEEMST